MSNYYYNPKTGERISGGKIETGWIRLTLNEYNALGLITSKGGYEAIASAAYKCGADIPQDDSKEKPEYALGYCGKACTDKKQPVRYFDYGGGCDDYLCRDCWNTAEQDKAQAGSEATK